MRSNVCVSVFLCVCVSVCLSVCAQMFDKYIPSPDWLCDSAVSEGQLVQLGEQIMGDVLHVIILRPQDELDPLGRRVWERRGKWKRQMSQIFLCFLPVLYPFLYPWVRINPFNGYRRICVLNVVK